MTRSRLSPARARLLAALRDRSARWSPLTATQQGIWLAEQLDPGASGYHDTAAVRIEGQLNPDALYRALGDIQAAHDALRTRVADTDGVPRQCFDVDAVEWGLVDLTGVAAGQRPVRLNRLVAAVAAEPFDLQTGPLWRVRLVCLSVEEHMLILVLHHLIADGWSHRVLLESLLAGYAAWLAGRVRRESDAHTGSIAAAVAAGLRGAPYRMRLPGFDPEPAGRSAAELPVPLSAGDWGAIHRIHPFRPIRKRE